MQRLIRSQRKSRSSLFEVNLNLQIKSLATLPPFQKYASYSYSVSLFTESKSKSVLPWRMTINVASTMTFCCVKDNINYKMSYAASRIPLWGIQTFTMYFALNKSSFSQNMLIRNALQTWTETNPLQYWVIFLLKNMHSFQNKINPRPCVESQVVLSSSTIPEILLETCP